MKLLELLNLLISFGPKIPLVMAEVEAIIAAVQRIVAMFASPKFAAVKPKSLNQKEAALVLKIAAASPKSQKFGGPFTTIFQWLKSNPWAVEFILGLLLKAKK